MAMIIFIFIFIFLFLFVFRYLISGQGRVVKGVNRSSFAFESPGAQGGDSLRRGRLFRFPHKQPESSPKTRKPSLGGVIREMKIES